MRSYVTVKLLALVAVPATVVTEIFPVVAPVGHAGEDPRRAERRDESVEAVPLNFTDCTP